MRAWCTFFSFTNQRSHLLYFKIMIFSRICASVLFAQLLFISFQVIAKQRVKDMSKAPKISEVQSTQSSSDDPNSGSSNRRRSAKKVAVPPPEAKKLTYGFFHVHADGTEIADPSRSSLSAEGSNGSEREPLVTKCVFSLSLYYLLRQNALQVVACFYALF